MNKARLSKIWFGFIALSVFTIVCTDLYLSAVNETGLYQYGWQRFLNTLVFFTVISNILVGISSYLIFSNKKTDDTFSLTLQFSSLICIFITGVVYRVMLASEAHNEGLMVITDFFLHVLIPVAYVLGWIFLIKRGKITSKIVTYALLIPIAWSIFTLAKGPLVGFYPYPFMDVDFLGYAKALINMGVITILFFALAYGFYIFDRKLTK